MLKHLNVLGMLNRFASTACGGRGVMVQRGTLLEDDEDGDRLMGVKVSAVLHEQIKQEAAKDGVTLRVIVLRALKAAGFTVNDEDLADRRPIRSGRRKAK